MNTTPIQTCAIDTNAIYTTEIAYTGGGNFNVEAVSIKDENGEILTLGSTEVALLYTDAIEYRRIKRFAGVFSEVKNVYREMLTLMQLMDPLDEDELKQLEQEIKDGK